MAGITELDIRHNGDRRHEARRLGSRSTGDRRWGDRRRRGMRSLLLAAALASPSHFMKAVPFPASVASVSVTMDSFTAIPASKAYETLIQEAAAEYRLAPALIRAVMQTESAFNPLVVSPVGAQGLMQLMPALAEEMGVTDPFDPRQSIMGGAKYLRQLLDSHKGNVPLALASYNAGPGNVARYKMKIPPFKETRRYVKKITAMLAEDTND